MYYLAVSEIKVFNFTQSLFHLLTLFWGCEFALQISLLILQTNPNFCLIVPQLTIHTHTIFPLNYLLN